MEDKKVFYIDLKTVRAIYPCDISRVVKNLGVLEKYRDKKYTLKEINEIVAELVTKVPYIPHSMNIHINVMGNGYGYHHMLDIKNYNFKGQERLDNPEIKFYYEG